MSISMRKSFEAGWAVLNTPCSIEKGGGPRCPTCGLNSATLSMTGCPMQVIKMNPRLPKDGALDGVLNVKPNPPTMHAGMPRDPDLLARLKRMHEAKMKAKEENTVDFDPETAKYGINNLE